MSPEGHAGAPRQRTGRSATRILAAQSDAAARAVKILIWSVVGFTVANAVVLSVLRPGPMIIGRIVRVRLVCFLCEKLWHRVNWARILLSVIYAANVLVVGWACPGFFRMGPAWDILMAATGVVYVFFVYELSVSRRIADHVRG